MGENQLSNPTALPYGREIGQKKRFRNNLKADLLLAPFLAQW